MHWLIRDDDHLIASRQKQVGTKCPVLGVFGPRSPCRRGFSLSKHGRASQLSANAVGRLSVGTTFGRSTKGAAVSGNDYPADVEPDDPQSLAEKAFRAGERAEQARRAAQVAQRSAADSLIASADSHDRTANAYEEAAEQNERRKDEYRQHAAQHRKYAEEDRCIGERLRQMAESDSLGRSRPTPSSSQESSM